MSAMFTQSGCPLEILLPTTTSTCKCKKTYITRLLRELNVLKIGQNREISSFLRFLRFLTNFIIMYYKQKIYNRYETKPKPLSEPLANNTEL